MNLTPDTTASTASSSVPVSPANQTGDASIDSLISSMNAPKPSFDEEPGIEGQEVAAAPEAPKDIVDLKAPERENFTEKFATLVKRERQIALRESEIRNQLKDVKSFNEAKKLALTDPGKVIETLGLDPQEFYDNLTTYMLNGRVPENAHVKELSLKLQNLERERLEERQKAEQERARNSASQARQTVKDTVKTAGDRFELVNAYDQHDLVCDVIVEHYQQYGDDLPIEQAAQKVEEYLEAQINKAKQTKKYGSVLGAQPVAPAAPSRAPLATQFSPQPVSRTLTNSAASGSTEPVKTRSPDEDLAWAVKMLQRG